MLACAALAVLLGGCRPPRPEGAPLAIGAVRQPATSLLYVADEGGCFARERVDVTMRSFELGRDAIALLRAGVADVAIAFPTPTLRAAFEDDRLRVLTVLHSSTRNTRVVADGQRGIRTFADLAGRRIAATHGTNWEFYLDLVLRAGALSRPQVTVVDLPPDAGVEALLAGRLDAVVTADPYASIAEQRLGPRAAVLQTDVYSEFSLLVTRSDVLAAREPALRALVAALHCAEDLAAERPGDAARLVRPHFPELTAEALDAQLARVRWGLGLDNVLIDLLRTERDWMRDGGAHGRPPDVDRLVDPRVLDAVDPAAVLLLDPRRGAP